MTAKPILVDAYCCAGGATKGYQRAGFHVVGVDIDPQPNYCGDEFVEASAVDVDPDTGHITGGYLAGCVARGNRLPDGRPIAAYAGSPPCQRFSGMSNCRPGLAAGYPDLIAATRALFAESGLPWILENVEGSPLTAATDLFGSHGVTLCGRMFGLALYRHRIFEASFQIPVPDHPRHDIPASKAGHWEPGTIISVAGNVSPIAVAREAMGGVDWMTRAELSESIPPPYTEFLGGLLLGQVSSEAAA